MRHLEDEIRKREQPEKKQQKPIKNGADPYIIAIEEDLRELLRTTVKIKKNKDKGKIEILYYSNDDLQRLLDIFHGKPTG